MIHIYKIFLMVLIILASRNIYSQGLSGRYCYSYAEAVDCFTFYDENRVRFFSFQCTHSKNGIGSYKIINDYLVIEFDSIKIDEEEIEIRTVPNMSDSVLLSVRVYEKYDKKIMYGALIHIEDNNGNQIRKITDEDGVAELYLPSSEDVKILKIIYIGYESIQREINLNKDYFINAGLGDIFPSIFYPIGTRFIYKIGSADDNKISLKGLRGDEYEVYFRKD
jgi:hypothetical protein